MEASVERTEEVPSEVRASIKEFLRLDDGLKQARLDMKESRGALNTNRDRVIEYMKETDTPKLSVRKGEVTLILSEKELKIRPDATTVKDKLQELLSQGVTDPQKIWEELDKCGGTRTVWKLARRSKRRDKKASKPKRKRSD